MSKSIERASCIEAEMLADFFPELSVECKPVRVSNREEMDPLHFWILVKRLEELTQAASLTTAGKC